jgi:hypothetical protein
MSDNTITDLRAELFATLRGLRDKKDPLDVDRARAVAQVAGVIIDSAKAEIEFARVTGGDVRSSLLPEVEPDPATPLPAGITGRTVHRIKG